MISSASNIIQLDLISDLMLRAKNAPELSTKFQNFDKLSTLLLNGEIVI